MIFIRVVEQFSCERCATLVQGNGYTNHCPKCLWSKHVDTNPGDRAALCGGMMQPELLERGGDVWILTHKCVACGHRKRNRLSPHDDFDAALEAVAPKKE